MSIWDEIQAERERQAEKWGGDEHDDQHTTFDWIAILTKQVGKAVMPGDWGRDGESFDPAAYRQCLIKVAATTVAAIQWVDRNWAGQKLDGEDATD